MNSKPLINIVRFVIILFVQVILLNNIQLWGLFTPFFYILFILLLPINIPKWLLLVFAFFTGIIIDIFDNTIGIHTFSLIFIGFLRPFILRIWAPHDGFDIHKELLPNEYGYMWFLKYSFLLVSIHQLILYFIEAFSFNHMGVLLSRWVVNSTLTELVILITVFAFEKKH